jgi:hypothetical protein
MWDLASSLNRALSLGNSTSACSSCVTFMLIILRRSAPLRLPTVRLMSTTFESRSRTFGGARVAPLRSAMPELSPRGLAAVSCAPVPVYSAVVRATRAKS